MLFLVPLVLALIASLVLTRVVRDHAVEVGLLDPCNDRSLHTEPVPRVGGVAIVVSTAIGLLVTWQGFAGRMPPIDRPLTALLVGAGLMHVFGLVDDIRPVPARYKLAAQTLLAFGVWYFGLRIPGVFLQGAPTIFLAPWLNMFLTVVWLVGLTNAFNLIDGLDGLAAGAALIALGALFLVSLAFGHLAVAIVICAVVGATFGFFRYNFPFGSIFLGDSGSLLLGFALAGLGLLSSRRSDGSLSIVIPILALGLPIIDTGIAIVRRYLRGQPIFDADRGHIHHRLLARGHTPRNAALILYVGCAALGASAVILANFGAHVLLPLGFAALAMLVFIQWLRFDEFIELGVLLQRGLRHRDVIGRNVRFREATLRIASLENMTEILDSLAPTFEAAGVPRAEIRLQRSFLNGVVAGEFVGGRADDELPIWKWFSGEETGPSSWTVSFPLLGSEERIIGCLMIWETRGVTSASLSHITVISEHLRRELQRKLYTFEWAIAAAVNADATATDANGIAVNQAGQPVGTSVMGITPPLQVVNGRNSDYFESKPVEKHKKTRAASDKGR